MGDIYSILSAGYKSAALAGSQSVGKYVNVDPAAYEGTWTGKYADNASFKFQISNVHGFKATVRYQSRALVQYQDVLIKNDSFRIGDTKFTLQKNGAAQIKSVTTDPATGGTNLDTAYARRS